MENLGSRTRYLPARLAIGRSLRVPSVPPAVEQSGRAIKGETLFGPDLGTWLAMIAQQKSAGQLILVEEPEAHLHPQLQLSLIAALNELPFQTILTTHSTHVTSQASLSSVIALTNTGRPASAAAAISTNSDLAASEVKDLERYLDATKSNLLFARKVMLVEGPAELFLITASTLPITPLRIWGCSPARSEP